MTVIGLLLDFVQSVLVIDYLPHQLTKRDVGNFKELAGVNAVLDLVEFLLNLLRRSAVNGFALDFAVLVLADIYLSHPLVL